jgi:hypothetical protein
VSWVVCWFSHLPQGFFSGPPVFLPPQKSTFPNSNSTRNRGPSENYLRDNDVILVKHGKFILFFRLTFVFSICKSIKVFLISHFKIIVLSVSRITLEIGHIEA